MFNMFEELFSPGRKHTEDERNRLEMTRVDVADGDPGRGPIDLESGKVVVRLPETETEAAVEAEPEAGRDPSADASPTTPEAPESGRPQI